MREDGEAALAHASRGRPSPRRLPARMRDRILHLARTRYVGFNDHHLCEKLSEIEGISLGRETLRRLLRQNGLGSPKKQRAPTHRQRRLCTRVRALQSLTCCIEAMILFQGRSTKNRPVFGLGSSFGEPQGKKTIGCSPSPLATLLFVLLNEPVLGDDTLRCTRDRVANFRADRNKGGTKSAGKTRQTRVRMPSRVSAFLSNFVKAKNKKRRGCSQGWRTRRVAFNHICQPDLL